MGLGPNYHLALRRSCPGCGQFASMVAAHQEYVPGPDKAPCECAEIKAERRFDEQLGWIARIAFAGAWRAAVEAHEASADVERLPEVERLLTRAVRQAAAHDLGDAADSARSAARCCPEVPALLADVRRIIAILEAT